MMLTDIQLSASRKSQRWPYTFLCWNQGMGKSLVALHALVERSLEVRGNRGVYIHVDPHASKQVLSYALTVMDRTFKMTCYVKDSTLMFGNGSTIKLVGVDQFLTAPFAYDFIIIDDSHLMDCADSRYEELLNSIQLVERGRESLKRVLETRLRVGEVVSV